MPTMGETVGEGTQQAVQPGAIPLLFGEGDHPWRTVAEKLGANGFYPFVVHPGGNTDTYKPGAYEADTPAEPVELPEPVAPEAPALPRSGFLLGGVAVEAADVIRADALPGEAETRARYERFLGGVAMHASTEASAEQTPPVVHRSSLDLLRDAARGDRESFTALLADTQTHIYEVLGGVGEGMKVRLKIGAHGPEWAGQNDEARQFHSLTSYSHSPAMLKVRHAEGIGSFRLTDRHAEGQLTGKAVFDLSAMARASQAELAGAGYFLNSIGVCIRRSTFGSAEQEISSLFVAGVDQRKFAPKPGETEAQEAARQAEALEARFDITVLRKMYALFGVEGAEHMEPDELLATQLVTPEEFDEIDMAMLYDQLAAEEMEEGTLTFFGSAQMWKELGSPARLTREHYDAHMRAREQRQASYQTLCESVVREQIRRQHQANTPLEAAELKRRVVLDMLVDRAIDVGDVDATRLGRESAAAANAARERYAAGDRDGGNRERNQAKDKARDPSCPPGEQKKPGATGDEDDKRHEGDNCREVKDGDAVHCPYCNQNVRAIVPKKGGRIYCSNGKCDAAFSKESPEKEKKAEKGKANSGSGQPLFTLPGRSTKQPADDSKR